MLSKPDRRGAGTPAQPLLAWLLLVHGLAGVPLALSGTCALAALLAAFPWQALRPGRTGGARLPADDPLLGAGPPTHCTLGRGGPLTAQLTAALHASDGPAQGLAAGPARRAVAPLQRVPLARLQRNVLALGSPGSGKSSLLVLLAWQAQRRGEAVVMIDPKGSRALRSLLAAGARRAGRPFLVLDAGASRAATRYDPLRHCHDGAACADRLCGLVGDHRHDPFREFSWGALAALSEALIATGEHPTIARLRALVPDAGQALLALPSPPGVDPADRRSRALAGVQALVAHDRTHYRKMTAPLLPLMELLGGGGRAGLLCAPDAGDSAVSLDLWRCREQGATVHVSLDALGQPRFSTALAWLLLDDLARLAGRGGCDARLQPALQVVVDEAGEVACEPLLRLLGKGREAGVNVTLATQTLADLDWRLGGPAAAQVALGNAAAWFLFRQLDARSRLESEARLGEVPVLQQRWVESSGRSSGGGRRRHSRGISQGSEHRLLPRVPAAAFAALRELECIAHLPEGEILHLRLPRPVPA